MLGSFDQMALYNAMNFSRSIYSASNSTVYATGLSSLWCPSDGQISGKRLSSGAYCDNPNLIYAFTSYAGCTGTWWPEMFNYYAGDLPGLDGDLPELQHHHGHAQRGLYLQRQSQTIATITDGTSNTIMYGEHANGRFTTANPRASIGGAMPWPSTPSSRPCIPSTPSRRFRIGPGEPRGWGPTDSATRGSTAHRASILAASISPSATARSDSSRSRSVAGSTTRPRAIRWAFTFNSGVYTIAAGTRAGGLPATLDPQRRRGD